MRVGGVRVCGMRVCGVRVCGVRVCGMRVCGVRVFGMRVGGCTLYTSPRPRAFSTTRMPSSACTLNLMSSLLLVQTLSRIL